MAGAQSPAVGAAALSPEAISTRPVLDAARMRPDMMVASRGWLRASEPTRFRGLREAWRHVIHDGTEDAVPSTGSDHPT